MRITTNNFIINTLTKSIKCKKGATAIKLHRILQDFADRDSIGDDMIDITDATPSIRICDCNIILRDGWHVSNPQKIKGNIKYERNI